MFDDAPIDQAVEGMINGIFFNQGQSAAPAPGCWCRRAWPTRCWTGSNGECARCGWGIRWTRTPTSAPSIPEQLAKIRELSRSARTRARSAGRRRASCRSRGFWFPPTVFTDVSQAHRIAREEIFGPVLSVLTFRTPAEAVEKANNTPYGLSAGVWTEKGSRILWMADQLRAGVVWANTFNRFDPTSPFGGYKESGYGREGGRHGLAAYLAHWTGAADSASARRTSLHRRGIPTQGVRPFLRRGRCRASSWRTRRRRPARTPGTRSWPPARRSAAGRRGRAYNRGQILYRVAEVLEGRHEQFIAEVAAARA